MQAQEGIKKRYADIIGRRLLFLFFLSVSLVCSITASVLVGSASISAKDVICALFSKLVPFCSSSGITQTIVWELRLPRVLMAVVAGIAFAVAGTIMQGVLRNPLASPYTLGMASGAAFGAALAIVLGIGVLSSKSYGWLIVTNAFIFSLIPSFIVVSLAKLKGASPETLILSGIAMMYLFSAGTSLLQYVGREEDVAAVVYWLFGSLSKATWRNLRMVSFTSLPLLIPALKLSWDFNALTAGDEVAKSLGVNVEMVRLGGVFLSSLLTAIPVCFLGTIGFIGLVAPHMARMIVGVDHRFLFPASGLLGALILLIADTAARTILSPIVLPVGVLTSFLGVPLFLYLMIRRRREYW